MKFAPRNILGEQVDAIRGLHGLDQVHDKGMIILSQHLDFSLHLARNMTVDLVDALQRIRKPCAVLHEVDNSGCSAADFFHFLQVGQLDAWVLQPDPVLQLLGAQRVILHHGLKRLFGQCPHLSAIVAANLDGGGARLVVKDGALAEVGVSRELADDTTANSDERLPIHDDKKMFTLLALKEDCIPFPIMVSHSARDQDVQLRPW
mmetsp:Transcript_74414/g.215684  ORF Transcript_74414/g.215684 Transcript_74414/m.215684 type:complete len:205 (+) Transcript_74414:819-1433(+)